MIENTLIHFKTKTAFNTELEAGNIKDTSVVFIKETLEIWTHGEFYSLKNVLTGDGSVNCIVAMTQAEYDALETKDPTTLYIITD